MDCGNEPVFVPANIEDRVVTDLIDFREGHLQLDKVLPRTLFH